MACQGSEVLFHTTDQLFVLVLLLEDGPSKQRLPRWVVEAITHTYESTGHAVPSPIHCHYMRALATSGGRSLAAGSPGAKEIERWLLM